MLLKSFLARDKNRPSSQIAFLWKFNQWKRMFSGSAIYHKEYFVQGQAANYIEAMYKSWQDDPKSVHLSWQVYFNNLDSNSPVNQAFIPPPTIVPSSNVSGFTKPSIDSFDKEISDHMKVQLLVRAYQVRGHHLANLDPLAINIPDPAKAPELNPQHYGFTEADYDRHFHLGDGILAGFRSANSPTLSLRDIMGRLKETYCKTIGFEYTHIPGRVECDWIRKQIEKPEIYKFSKAEKAVILDRLIFADSFERFIHSKYPGEKRFGLDGGETVIPGMKALFDRSVDGGVENIVIGMPHRGRLNVLSNVVRKPNESIFCEFSGNFDPHLESSGDVKYHLGMTYDRKMPDGKIVNISLVANPSHLEAVNPVVQGKTKALQFYGNDTEKTKAMGILLHGDAAFAAQGVVYESLGFCDLPSYTTGGTIHVVVNNQIGFTTDPRFARSTPYCSDIAKAINVPIFHVNGDDVEAVVFVSKLAVDWRYRYKRDVVIDLVCYRRHGHNEFDEPSFTQPLMYKRIGQKKRVVEIYSDQLIAEGVFTKAEIDANKKLVWEKMQESYDKSKDYVPTTREWQTSSWPGFKSPKELSASITREIPTGLDKAMLQNIGKIISSYPKEFDIHKSLGKILASRMVSIEKGEDIDMPTAEALAFGSLMEEGNHVRLSGQDVERGTFSQRHAVLHDQSTERQYVPLSNLSSTQAKFTVCNSSLSEFGVLGFELGYSFVDPNSLVMWEAQFGDFCNNAQCIIDQFISSGEQKWIQRTGLTMLLPHGYDGAGPEHSSGRMERFLQLCDDHPKTYNPATFNVQKQMQDSNMAVVYCSTPANYFHALRRQVHREFRKPLIVFNSKNLLRHPLARSSFEDMITGTSFQRVLPEESSEIVPSKVKKVIMCSGQVYYQLYKAREMNKITDVAIVRLEQISPFPFDLVHKTLDQFAHAKSIVWCQEEAMNMGAWTYVDPRIETALQNSKHHVGKRPTYVGRMPSAAVATGKKKQHVLEEQSLLSEALLGKSQIPKEVKMGIPIW